VKKIRVIIVSAVVFCMSLPCFSALAFASENSMGFGLTGKADSAEESEVTFDSTKTISGTADEGTGITIRVYTKNSAGKYRERYSYDFNVGLSGLFSQTVALNIGENVICVDAEKNGDLAEEKLTVKRKADDIKDELERGIYLP